MKINRHMAPIALCFLLACQSRDKYVPPIEQNRRDVFAFINKQICLYQSTNGFYPESLDQLHLTNLPHDTPLTFLDGIAYSTEISTGKSGKVSMRYDLFDKKLLPRIIASERNAGFTNSANRHERLVK